MNNDNFFINDVIRTILFTTKPFIKDFIYVNDYFDIILSDNIKYNKTEHSHNLFMLNESVYKDIEKVNYNLYKEVELFINKNQKKLQIFLKDEFNINMNGHIVSRAWIKVYEIYSSVNYFSNIEEETINVFHICEAPGNFIISSLYYTQHNTKIKNYNWRANSLQNADIGDMFGFIQNTRDKWDYGKDGTGNIMNYQNLKYYMSKYKGIDSLVGDCGMCWSNKSNTTQNLGTTQMLYALLFPRIGGNFIIKTFALNYDIQFLSLLYTAKHIYENVFIFRASRNLWSPEIYIIGKNKRKINKEQEDILLKMAERIDKGDKVYPINYLPIEFVMEFEYYTQHIIKSYTKIKKLFVYFARNQKMYETNKDLISKAIDRKNILWLNYHMRHLEYPGRKYKKYYSNGDVSSILNLSKKILKI